MNFHLFGLSHHSAPVALREQFAVAEARLPAALAALVAEPGVEEGLILSTCNRVEVLSTGTSAEALRAFLGRWVERDLAPLSTHFYAYSGPAAARHVFRVAASLDSLVVGEPQILGQYKAAYQAAINARAAGPGLRALLHAAFSAAKLVRGETAIGRQSLSISHAAVDLAKRIFGGLGGKTVLLVGAGEMGTQAAGYLLQQGARRLLVANRGQERAAALAAKYGGEVVAWSDLLAQAHRADVIISCTGAAAPLLDKAEMAGILARRKYRPLLLLDIAVPRDIAADVQELENAFLYNVDDLEGVVEGHRADRQREAARAEAMIETELERFARRWEARDALPTLRALETHAESLRQSELERWRAQLTAMPPEQRALCEELTRALMRKWLHRPLTAIKAAAEDDEDLALLDSVAQLFGLKENPAAAPETAASTPTRLKAGA